MRSITAPYQDPTLEVEARIVDLLGRMTRDEKLAQLGAVWAFQLLEDTSVDLEPRRRAHAGRHR